jgi:[ribosomal protein S18]-alanine N-acetyltransferase
MSSALSFRPLTAVDAGEIASWRYGGDYAVYDHDQASAESLLDPAFEYYAAVGRGGELVGYACFGEDARVAGLAAEEGVLDVGGALRPDLTGIGLGAGFLRASCELGRELHEPREFRVVIAAFNRRAQRVASALGFEAAGFHSTGERDYVVLRRAA